MCNVRKDGEDKALCLSESVLSEYEIMGDFAIMPPHYKVRCDEYKNSNAVSKMGRGEEMAVRADS